MTELGQNLRDLPSLLAWHLLLSMSAVGAAAATAMSMALLADRRPGLRNWILAAAGVLQTIPGLALLALMVPLLGGAIGFAPAFVALTVYALLPLLQNTVTGLTGTDPQLVEAARGLGMTERQVLLRVRFPLAFPVILAGLRTSTVWTVGTTTLATAVGAAGLGSYIFTGLQTRNHPTTLFGCFFAAVLAVALDQSLRVVEDAVRRRRRMRARLVGAGLALALAASAGLALWPRPAAPAGPASQTAAAGDPAAADPGRLLAGQRFVTGSKTFVESHVLAALVGLQLQAAGAEVVNRPSMGSTILFDALRSDAVDCYVDYTGTVWATLMKRGEPASRLRTRVEAAAYLLREHRVLAVGHLGFRNDYALAMREDRAEEFGIRTIADLSGRDLEIGGDPEVFGRPEWDRVREVYGLESLLTRPMQAIYMFDAVRAGQVDVITAYTTDGRLAEGGLSLLDDPLHGFPPYDAILLVSPAASRNAALVAVLGGLVNRIDDRTMGLANRRVEVDGESPERAARWLWERTGGPLGDGESAGSAGDGERRDQAPAAPAGPGLR